MKDELKPRLSYLVEAGALELMGRGRGVRYVLARRFYAITGRKGVYTRTRGLDRETNKALLVKHISDNNREGSQFRDLRQVLPSLSIGQLKALLKELKEENRIYSKGKTKAGLWHIVTKHD